MSLDGSRRHDLDTAGALRQRARDLARPPVPEPVAGARIEVLEFRLANERYAFETRHVSEVCALRQLTPLPGVPPFVRGIINVRSRIHPVLDLKRIFDLPEAGLTDLHSVVLVRGEGLEFGLLADAVDGVSSLGLEQLQAPLPTLTEIREEFVLGITSEHLVVLDLPRLFTDPRIVVHDEIND